MMRFTDTDKWDKPWYRKLTPQAKHLLNWLRDKCDRAGVIDLDLETVSWHVGEPITEKHLAELESRLQHLPSGKILMPKFIHFQYGQLSSTCGPHQRVLKLVAAHGLVRVDREYRYIYVDLAQNDANATGSTKQATLASDPSIARAEEEDKKKKKKGVQGETKSHTRDSLVLPHTLRTSEFLLAWTDWLEHLREKNTKPTRLALDRQLARLAAMGVPKAIATINHSIEHNWQGLFEEKPDTNPNHPQSQKPFHLMTAAEKVRATH